MKAIVLLVCLTALQARSVEAQVTTTSVVTLSGSGGPIAAATTQLLVTVNDSDRDTNPAQPDEIIVHIESPSDEVEPVTLLETGMTTGVFTGSIDFAWLASSAAPGVADGTVQGKSGDILSARDDDPADDFGNPVTVRSDALVHGIAGRLSGTFDVSGSPYVITGDAFVDKPDTLRILAGVEIRLRPDVRLTVRDEAYLEILGEPGNEVLFTAHDSGSSAAWGTLELQDDFEDVVFQTKFFHAVFEKGGSSPPGMILSNRQLRLDNCVLREAASSGIQSGWGNHVSLTAVKTAFLDSAADGCRIIGQLSMRDCSSTGNGKSGVVAAGYFPIIHATLDSVLLQNNGLHGLEDRTEHAQATVNISNCTIVENNGRGIFKTPGGEAGALVVSHSELRDNQSGYQIYNESTVEVTARFNDWGPATTAEMNAGMNPKDISQIYDFYDDGNLGFVNYSAWLNPTAVDATTWSRVKDRFR
jgi:hypothetical protein